MTIIDFMRKKLTEYPKISAFLTGDDIHIDFTEPGTGNYGLSSTGDSIIKTNIRGEQTRRNNFTMYAVGQSFTDYCRISNSNFLLELQYWLERLPEEDGIEMEIDGKKYTGRFLKASAANAMAMQLMGDTINEGVLYQIQIYATYQLKVRNA